MWVVPRCPVPKRSIKEEEMWLPFQSEKGKKKRNTKLIHRGVLEHILEAVIENWKLGASDVQVEEVTGAQGKGH